MRVLLQSLSAWFGNRVDKVMLPSLSAWYWTYGGQGHAAVSVCLVLDIGWTGSCCRLFLSGIGHKVDKVMPPSQPVSLVLDIWWTGSTRVMLLSLLISLVLNITWSGSCFRLYQSGIGHRVDRVNEGHATVSVSLVLDIRWTRSLRVMPPSLSVWYWT